MPSLVVALLRLDDPSAVRFRQLWGLACSLLDQDEDDHRARTKPFSVRPLGVQDGLATLGLGVLDDDRAARARDALIEYHRRSRPLRLGGQPATLAASPTLTTTPWYDLWRRAAERPRHLTLRFASPVMLTHGKVGTTPWPDLRALAGGWARKWTAFAPEEVPSLERWSLPPDRGDHLRVEAFEGRAGRVEHAERRDGGWRQMTYVGWFGWVTWSLEGLTEPEHRTLQALASLAPFAGSGARTTIGLGATDLLDQPPPATPR